MVSPLFSAAPMIVSVVFSSSPLNFQAGPAIAGPAKIALSASAASRPPRKTRVAFRFMVLIFSLSLFLGVFFVDEFHGSGRGDVDGVVEDRRVVAGGRRAQLGVDDRVDQEGEQAAAAGGFGRRPGVVDQFVAG